MEPVTIKLPKILVDHLDSLVEQKIYGSRSQAIREVLRVHFNRLFRELETS